MLSSPWGWFVPQLCARGRNKAKCQHTQPPSSPPTSLKLSSRNRVSAACAELRAAFCNQAQPSWCRQPRGGGEGGTEAGTVHGL